MRRIWDSPSPKFIIGRIRRGEFDDRTPKPTELSQKGCVVLCPQAHHKYFLPLSTTTSMGSFEVVSGSLIMFFYCRGLGYSAVESHSATPFAPRVEHLVPLANRQRGGL